MISETVDTQSRTIWRGKASRAAIDKRQPRSPWCGRDWPAIQASPFGFYHGPSYGDWRWTNAWRVLPFSRNRSHLSICATERDKITQVESRADVTLPNFTLRMYVETLFTPHPIHTRPSSASIANWLRAAEGAVHRLASAVLFFHLMYCSSGGGQVV